MRLGTTHFILALFTFISSQHLLAADWSTQVQVKPDNIHFNLFQRKHAAGYMTGPELERWVRDELITQLTELGAIAPADDSKATPVFVSIDYYRGFAGQFFGATSRIGDYFFQHRVKAAATQQWYVGPYEERSAPMLLPSPPGSTFSDSVITDLAHIQFSVARAVNFLIANGVSDHQGDYPNETQRKQFITRLFALAQNNAKQYRGGDISLRQYIPKSQVRQWIQMLGDEDELEELYKLLFKKRLWINDLEFYDAVEKRLLSMRSDSGQWHGNDDETIYLARILGTSGMQKYLPTLQIMQAHKDQRYVWKSGLQGATKLEEHAAYAAIIHQPTPTLASNATWQDQQAYNMLKVPHLALQELGARSMYSHKRYSEPALQQLVTLLKRDAFSGDLMARYGGGSHAWLAKALGASNQKKYYKLLRNLEDNAASKKTRQHAESWADHLEDLD